MNELAEILKTNKANMAAHDFFKSVASYFIQKVNLDELYKYVELDYRVLEFIDISQLSLDQKKHLIDLNIESFYALYKNADLELFDYAVKSKNAYQNIFNTTLNVLAKYVEYDKAFDYVFENINLFEGVWALKTFLESNPNIFTKEQISKIIKAQKINYVEYIGDFGHYLIRYDDQDILSKSLIHHLNEDNNYFYELYDQLIKNECFNCELLSILNVISGLEFDYEKVINLYHKNPDYRNRELIEICVDNNWLQVFDDLQLDYMKYCDLLFYSKKDLDLSLISKYDSEVFGQRILKTVLYINWNDLKKFMRYTTYLKLKLKGFIND